MDSPTLVPVFVAAMAKGPHAVPATARAGDSRAGCASDCLFSMGPLAYDREGSEPSSGHRVLDRTGFGECDLEIPPTSGNLVNRRMRTRMSGGVEGE